MTRRCAKGMLLIVFHASGDRFSLVGLSIMHHCHMPQRPYSSTKKTRRTPNILTRPNSKQRQRNTLINSTAHVTFLFFSLPSPQKEQKKGVVDCGILEFLLEGWFEWIERSILPNPRGLLHENASSEEDKLALESHAITTDNMLEWSWCLAELEIRTSAKSTVVLIDDRFCSNKILILCAEYCGATGIGESHVKVRLQSGAAGKSYLLMGRAGRGYENPT
jgi:hypothetical protein